jgi:hypothetical protein
MSGNFRVPVGADRAHVQLTMEYSQQSALGWGGASLDLDDQSSAADLSAAATARIWGVAWDGASITWQGGSAAATMLELELSWPGLEWVIDTQPRAGRFTLPELPSDLRALVQSQIKMAWVGTRQDNQPSYNSLKLADGSRAFWSASSSSTVVARTWSNFNQP